MLTRGDGVIRPDEPCASPVPLVTARGVTLQPIAMEAFREAERLAGRRIEVIQSYRSCARQARACESICGNPDGCPGLCAPPGLSYHQIGAAVDISQAALDTPGVKAALEEAGWCQSIPGNDPGHFSFGGCH
ncbi:MAG: D-alanyl-D-alanine carboxypeptidase family protein [Actinomycetota bacterium]